jgi:hypothetical protein
MPDYLKSGAWRAEKGDFQPGYLSSDFCLLVSGYGVRGRSADGKVHSVWRTWHGVERMGHGAQSKAI